MAYKNITKKQGRDFNFFQVLPVNWTHFGAPDGYTIQNGYGPDVVITFPTQGVSFINYGTGATNSIEYSFNGTTVHGEMIPGTASSALVFDFRTVCLIWFRLKAGSTGPVDIRIEAWGKD